MIKRLRDKSLLDPFLRSSGVDKVAGTFLDKKGGKKKTSVLDECRSKWKKVLIGVAVVALGYGAQAEDGKVDVKDEVCYPQSPIAYCGQ